MSDRSSPDFDLHRSRPLPPVQYSPQLVQNTFALTSRTAPAHPSKLFTAEELAVLPADSIFERQRMKQAAKKAKKRKAEAEKTEGELTFGLLGVGLSEEDHDGLEDRLEDGRTFVKRSKKEKMKAAKLRKKMAEKAASNAGGMEMEVDEDIKKEQDFAKFLAGVGGEFFAFCLYETGLSHQLT